MSKLLKFISILSVALIVLFNSSYIFAAVNMDLGNTLNTNSNTTNSANSTNTNSSNTNSTNTNSSNTNSSNTNSNSSNSTKNTSTSTSSTLSSTVTTSDFDLELTNILCIALIVVGVLLILLGIAILIRLKK